MGNTRFDAAAAHFDRFRGLPLGIPAAIRNSVWDTLRYTPGARLLDVGAGTGRIGEAFVAAGDAYIAIDASAGMLAQFAAKVSAHDGPRPLLVQGDGQSLPFPAAAFDAVLIVQVVSGLPGWRRLLSEALRVLRPGGGLVLGQRIAPADGLDARMRSQLSLILAELGIDARRPGGGRDDTRQWVAAAAERMVEVVAARWDATRSPRDFLDRHATGARFTALPQPVRDEAMRRLTAWSIATFGSLDAEFIESHTFVLDVCVI